MIDDIILKFYSAPSNLSVGDVDRLMQHLDHLETAEHDQASTIRKLREALESIHTEADVHGYGLIARIVDEALDDV